MGTTVMAPRDLIREAAARAQRERAIREVFKNRRFPAPDDFRSFRAYRNHNGTHMVLATTGAGSFVFADRIETAEAVEWLAALLNLGIGAEYVLEDESYKLPPPDVEIETPLSLTRRAGGGLIRRK